MSFYFDIPMAVSRRLQESGAFLSKCFLLKWLSRAFWEYSLLSFTIPDFSVFYVKLRLWILEKNNTCGKKHSSKHGGSGQ